MARPIPRPFKYERGGGQIVEEVAARNEYYEPVIQLLRCEGGDHDGEELIPSTTRAARSSATRSWSTGRTSTSCARR